jgi:prepilin-type N-terminal cleavage/methylation domain-containing protein
MLTRLRSDQAGVTLVELLVVVVLLGVVGSITMAGIISGLHATRRGEARVEALNDLQKGIERVGRELRAAEELRFESGTDPRDVVIAQVVRGGERIRYRYYLMTPEGGTTELREDVRRETLTGGLISTQDGLFIANIANPETGTPLFTYYATDPVTRQLQPVTCDVAEDACLQRHAAATQVKLTLQRLLPEQAPITVETVVNVRSTRLGGA